MSVGEAVRCIWQAAQAWHKGFLSKEAQYKTQNIVPLMQAHMAFYTGDLLLQVMTHQYDIQSPKCGVAYVKSVIEIIKGTQQYAQHGAKYLEQLKATSYTPKNYLKQALVYNQNQVKALFEKLKAQGLQLYSDTAKIGWNGLFGGIEGVMGNHVKHNIEMLGMLTEQLSLPIGQLTKQVVKGKGAGFADMVPILAFEGKAAMRVEFKGTKLEFITYLTQQLQEMSGAKVNNTDLKRAVRMQVLELQKNGDVNLKQMLNEGMVLVLDKSELDAVNLSPANKARLPQLAGAIVDINDAAHNNWLNVSKRMRVQIKAAGVAGAMLQMVSCVALAGDVMQDKNGVTSEAGIKFGAGVAGFVSGVSGSVAGHYDIQAKADKLAKNTSSAGEMAKTWSKVSKGFGLVAAVTIYFDARDAFENLNRGFGGMAFIGFVSVGASFTGLYALLASGVNPVVGLVAAIVAVLAGLYLAFGGKSGIEKWLYNCYWGQNPIWQNNFDTELNALENAIS